VIGEWWMIHMTSSMSSKVDIFAGSGEGLPGLSFFERPESSNCNSPNPWK